MNIKSASLWVNIRLNANLIDKLTPMPRLGHNEL